ncbi:MAG: TIR domain-containing protein [Candidatus Aminicenantes bacterium]|nr:TIR domain-containing protein [Candidatus Aminicenantes bacterium]NIM83406.1 TIR domain-containing protein [Candidatus Aminicenantes bacterium]NIN22798.1 TIR domain-containing protein [Candidatus Aminicenantes bacterium]NIN46532.1 TIR domain-containing protein [Candidatus Aminicenantes bacterium]NIN89437.1 TIR domain-containing protein [Candidatus Aminicenantes bacterium]
MPSVFISYSSKDKDFVFKLASDLKYRGIDVWLDEWEINVGDEIRQKIEEGIEKYEYFIIILSTHSTNSTWVQKELNAAYMKEIELNKVVILPVLVENCMIPKLISGKLYADFSSSYQTGLNKLLKVLTPNSIKSENTFDQLSRESLGDIANADKPCYRSILIVDDDIQLLNELGRYFEDSGFSVYSTYGIQEAIELAERNTPDFIFIDLWWDYRDIKKIKEHKYLSSYRRLKKVAPNAKVVGMSPYDDTINEIEEELDYVLKKPFVITDITQLFERLL